MRLAATAATLSLLALASIAGAQENRSLTNSGIRVPQVNTGGAQTFAFGPAVNAEEDSAAALQERLVLSENTIRQLTQSLANANAEVELRKRQAADLSLKLQALGTNRDEDEIESRLLAAVRDLRIAKQDNENYRTAMIQLSEAVVALLKGSENISPNGRMAVETELRRANELLGAPTGVASAEAVDPTLQEAMVVDVRDELSLIVANIGEKQGAKIGMPFQVWRDNQKIGEVRVIDVRDRISGAVIQSLENNKNPVKAGDRLRVDAQRPQQ
jgi:small-conductance mechanosensitive channel